MTATFIFTEKYLRRLIRTAINFGINEKYDSLVRIASDGQTKPTRPDPTKKPNPARSKPVLGPVRSEPVLSPKAGTGLGFYRFSWPEPVSARPDFFLEKTSR